MHFMNDKENINQKPIGKCKFNSDIFGDKVDIEFIKEIQNICDEVIIKVQINLKQQIQAKQRKK